MATGWCYTEGGRESTMKHIDISELPKQTDDEIRGGNTFAVERDGEVLGYFVPRRKKNPEKLLAELEALNRTIDEALSNGYTREQLSEDLDLGKPLRSDI